jgi:hypothetical protein
MHLHSLAVAGLVLFASAMDAAAGAPPPYNRRAAGIHLVPVAYAPGTYDVHATIQTTDHTGDVTYLDVQESTFLYVNGTLVSEALTRISFEQQEPVCTLDDCGSGASCALMKVGGIPVPATCQPMLPHPGDDAPWCGCSGVFEVTLAQQLPLQPGDELELRIEAAPGGAPEIYTVDDNWTIEVMSDEVTSYCTGDQTFSGCPCLNIGFIGQGCRNSTGVGALLFTVGSTSAGADELFFRSEGLPPAQPALLFAGTNVVNGGMGLPFGDGLRCVGGQVQRIGVMHADAGGTAGWGPGLIGALGWVPGDQRFVQDWYRDPAGPCATGFNLSNALEVHVTP